ncbi:glycosyltransferase family 2 protein [Saccharomonospora iraqiensis]|uniref:glycosyltransferase family 2 protein n=1 Tax=Saccharomonospora iraqiensis TaxID=52698 RepID=UPI00040A4AE5|nr:glycosyltransferase family 2 protein [Saccharomonospora iraqiensis]
MTRRVSIITAAYGPNAAYLPETLRSVREQQLPEGWELEWLIQEDGAQPQLTELFADIPGMHYEANHSQLGTAATRNLALSRATGELVQVLDHDDVLLPDALRTLIPRFEDPEIGWAVGQADDLLPDGTRNSYESALPFGTVARGTVNDWAIEHGGNWPIHCAALMMRTELVRALGGWAGAPIDEDIVMFAALSELVNGYNDPAVTWLYRLHEQQTHRAQTSKLFSEAERRIALQRVQALTTAGVRLAGQPAPAREFTVDVSPAAKDAVAPSTAWWKD